MTIALTVHEHRGDSAVGRSARSSRHASVHGALRSCAVRGRINEPTSGASASSSTKWPPAVCLSRARRCSTFPRPSFAIRSRAKRVGPAAHCADRSQRCLSKAPADRLCKRRGIARRSADDQHRGAGAPAGGGTTPRDASDGKFPRRRSPFSRSPTSAQTRTRTTSATASRRTSSPA